MRFCDALEAGGRVIADWPGVGEGDLHDGRDPKPTIDLRAVLKASKHPPRVDDRALADAVFPGSGEVRPMAGLVAWRDLNDATAISGGHQERPLNQGGATASAMPRRSVAPA